ncbi:putative S-adenosyl-L-methionine-dependent methyltransferase [Seiridium cardinale]|uniref:S-adenosyl-L-methionine-dependent methyltransferase n=1 Tax=Seiridium cardinale TaxID=138064 RepID=A0ABR2Y1F2_9PEZI
MAQTQKDHWSSEAYQKSASFVPKLATKIMQWLDPKPDDIVLDIGCGDGILDFQMAEVLSKGNGKVHGTDSSPSMIEASKKSATENGASQCTFEVVDALEIANTPSLQKSSFTKAFSNAAMHWILRCPQPKQETFFRGVRESLRPGGTFAFEMGGLGNVSEMRAGLLMGVARRVGLAKALEADPWFFPDEKWVTEIMEKTVGGWKVEKVEREWRPTPADEGGVAGWVRLMGKQFFEAIENQEERDECIKEVVEALEEVCRNPSGGFMFSYVRLRVLARKV